MIACIVFVPKISRRPLQLTAAMELVHFGFCMPPSVSYPKPCLNDELDVFIKLVILQRFNLSHLSSCFIVKNCHDKVIKRVPLKIVVIFQMSNTNYHKSLLRDL